MNETDQDELESWEYPSATDLELNGTKRLQSEKREVGLVGITLHACARITTKIFLRSLLRISVSGTHHFPRDLPFIIVSNHCSHLDALLISEILPARFTGQFFSLAAEDYFFDTPSKSIFATRWVNALPMRRGKAAAKALGSLRERAMNGYSGFIIFPEGTRSRNGNIATFKPGIGMLVAGTEIPVIPCHIEGSFEIWPSHRKLPRSGKVQITLDEPLSFPDHPNEKAGWLEISKTLEARVTHLRFRDQDERKDW